MKEMRKLPEGDPLAKWEAVSGWLSSFEDSDRWAIVMIDGDRYPCVTIGFILECVCRADWVAFDQVGTTAARHLRNEELVGGNSSRRVCGSTRSIPSYWTMYPQQLMEALMLQSGRWNNFAPEPILTDLYQNRHLWLSFLMLPLIGEDEDSNRLYSNLGYALRDLGYRWHADTLYVWSRDDDCVYPLVDLGKAWMADDVQVMDRDRASVFIGYGGSEDPQPIVIYWWD